MENHIDLINKFYTSFAARDVEGMNACYSDNIIFEDPAFGVLQGRDAKDMWRMLISRGDGNTIITHKDVTVDGNKGNASWKAKYNYGPTKRKVINNISAAFEFENGKIVKHRDSFDLWKWSRQALGLSGYLLGWSPIIKNKIRSHTNTLLKKFQEAETND